MKSSEIKALIRLLEDPNQEVFKAVSEKLKEYGTDTLPLLEASLGLTDNETMNARLQELISELETFSFYTDFEAWVLNFENKTLVEGLFFINALFYPDTKLNDFKANFEKLRKNIWLELNDNLTGFEAIKVVNHCLYFQEYFGVEKAQIDNLSFHFPETLFFDKKSSPFAFVGVYSALSQSLNLPVRPIYMPGLLLLAYENESVAKLAYGNDAGNVLFYINPYDKGGFLGRKSLDYVVKKRNIEAIPKHYNSIDNLRFIYLYLEYLKHNVTGSNALTDKVERLLEILNQNQKLS